MVRALFLNDHADSLIIPLDPPRRSAPIPADDILPNTSNIARSPQRSGYNPDVR